MTQCPECGARNAAESTFCVRCGRPFPVAAPVAPVAAGPDATRLVDDAAELYAAGRLDDAVAACRSALDLEPELVAARSLLGMLEEERGNPGAALAEFEAVTRLDPSRTVERDRAVRLRAQLSAQTGAPLEFDDPAKSRRRLLPIVAATGVGVLVLIIGAALSNGGSRNATDVPVIGDNALPQDMAGWNGQGTGADQSGMSQPPWPVAQESSPFPPTPIEPTIKDQSAGQPQSQDSGGVSRGGGGGGGAPPAITDVEPIPMPPPTVERGSGPGPLNPPKPVAPDRGRIVGGEPPAPVAPQPQPSRGQIRVWMGDDEGPSTPSPAQPSNPAPAPGGAAPGPTSSLLRPSGGGGAAGPAALTGGPRAQNWQQGGGGPVALAAAGRGGTNRAQASNSRTWTPAPANSGSRALAGQGRGPSGGTPTARRGGSNASFPAPTTQVAQRAPAPAAAAAPSAESLRNRAQQAWSAGRTDEARSMYRSAIAGYEREGRSGASRSAIQSCQRALEALDSGQ